MEKTKEQIVIEKLRKAGHKTRLGMRPPMGVPGCHGGKDAMRGPGPHGMPPVPPQGFPGGPGMMHGGPMHGGPSPMPGCPGHGPGPAGGMLPREMLLLTVLESGEDGVRQKDIADRIGIKAAALSEQIDRLETDRYLERKANPEDKRSTLIVLTEKGRARAYEVLDERQKAAADLCGKLTEEEKDTLIRLLDKLLAE